jgi:TolB-like protein/Tfp pilus assembly protein PilF/tRNA A-37 threonylcarbamoyl transferase component Bud32
MESARTPRGDVTREEWRRIKAVAAGALEQPDDARRAYLADACGDDGNLRDQVESLLASAAAASPLFETPSVLVDGARAIVERLASFDTSRVGEQIGAYRVVRELGGGGMGAAYLAVRADDSYEKTVAIKVLKRGMDTEAVLRRFRHERQILAGLDHPNIARLLDGGTTADGLPYFVMEYAEGVPIDRYCDDRRLSIRERISVFRRVCDAVGHAHAHRVIHRDLKPGNILVTADGVPKLLDFGISKVLAADPAESTESTAFSRAMTPQYASPEQMRGASVTAASDVYSLGLLLYELLTGRRAYSLDGVTLQQVDQIVCVQEPVRPSTHRRELAGDLDNIVLMALRKEPARRYATVDDLSDDLLRHLEGRPVRARSDDVGYRAGRFLQRHRVRAIEAALVLLLLIAAGVAWWSRRAPTGSNATVESLAVMPFAVTGGGADADYLSDGLAEGLIDGLSRVPRLKVLSRGTVFGFKGRAIDPRSISRDLHVQHVVLGSLVEKGSQVELQIEIVDGRDGHRVWGDRYSESMAGLSTLRDRIVRDVAAGLHVDLPNAASARRHSNDSEAYQLYLRGRYVWNKRTEDGFTRGLDYFRQALVKDPRYALAYTGIADCYNLLGIWGAMAPHDAMPKVKQAALAAIAIDNTLAEAHTSLAFVHWVYDWDWEAAGREFEEALRLDPSYATAHDWYAYYLASRGRFDDALAHVKQAQAIEPVSLSISTDVGEIYYWSRQYGRAVEQLRSVLQIEPEFAMARNILGLAYLKTGDLAHAVEELEAARRLSPGPRTMSTLAYGYGAAGAGAKAKKTLDELRDSSKQRYTSSFALAVAYAGAGDMEQALSELEVAFAERSDTMAVLRVYPVLDGLRNEPRFKDLLARVGTIP